MHSDFIISFLYVRIWRDTQNDTAKLFFDVSLIIIRELNFVSTFRHNYHLTQHY